MSRKVDLVTKKCLQCESIMSLYSRLMDRKKFCSRRCQGLFRLTDDEFIKKFKNKSPNSKSFKKNQNLGKDHPRYVESITLNCEYCKKDFSRKPWQLRIRGNKGRFCSTECRGSWRSEFAAGADAPDFVGGNNTYRGRGWKKIRLIVVANQKGHCFVCDKYVGNSLPVHHKIPFREFSDELEANKLSNLVGMCQSCHMKHEPRTWKKI
jgi:5-methylcytosine-specific restriction endonuclease McrA